MNTALATASRPLAPAPLVSAAARLVTAAGAAALLATVWLSAEQASHDAVRASQAAISRNVIYVTLPTVQIVGQRAVPAGSASAAMAPRDRSQRTL